MNQFLVRRLSDFTVLSDAEAAAVAALGEPSCRYARDSVIRAEGEPVNALFLLVDGWVTSSLNVGGQRRQMIKLHPPGDLLGTPSVALTHAGETLSAATAATLRRVPLAALAELFRHQPRLAALLFALVQQERIFLIDRMAAMGRTSAAQRLAAFLIHLYDRMRVIAPQHPAELRLPISQIDIADMLGLTPVHVNRVFRDLERAGLIERYKRHIRLAQLDALRDFAALPARRWAFEPGWLQPA